jgi:hypothetical protein
MDIVSPIICLLDFWKNFCCDFVASEAIFAKINNEKVAILENPNSYPFLESTTSISNHLFQSDKYESNWHRKDCYCKVFFGVA